MVWDVDLGECNLRGAAPHLMHSSLSTPGGPKETCTRWGAAPCKCPAWGRGTLFPPFSLVHSLPHLLLFVTFPPFPFLIRFTYFLLLSIPSLSTRIVPLRFQAAGRRRRPSLGLVCWVYFVLSVLRS